MCATHRSPNAYLSDHEELRAAEKALAQALEAPDPTAWVYHYTEDAIFVAPGAPAVQGRNALLQMANTMRPLSSVVIAPLRTEAPGDIAAVYARASWVSGALDGGAYAVRSRSVSLVR